MVGYSLFATRFAAIDEVMVCPKSYTMSAVDAMQLNERLASTAIPFF